MPDNFYVRNRTRKPGGFYRVHNAVITVHLPQIGIYGLAVYNALASYADVHTGATFVKAETVATDLGISSKTVHRSIDRMIEVGLIEKRSGKLKGRENTYVLLPISEGVKAGEGWTLTPDSGGGGLDSDARKEGGGWTLKVSLY